MPLNKSPRQLSPRPTTRAHHRKWLIERISAQANSFCSVLYNEYSYSTKDNEGSECCNLEQYLGYPSSNWV
jgi:hypothetical protein